MVGGGSPSTLTSSLMLRPALTVTCFRLVRSMRGFTVDRIDHFYNQSNRTSTNFSIYPPYCKYNSKVSFPLEFFSTLHQWGKNMLYVDCAWWQYSQALCLTRWYSVGSDSGELPALLTATTLNMYSALCLRPPTFVSTGVPGFRGVITSCLSSAAGSQSGMNLCQTTEK